MATSKSKLVFGAGGDLADSLILITGVARSGTTILGKIIASLEGIDYEYEPWIFAQLPILEQQGLIDSQYAAEMLRSFSAELFNQHLLGRAVNLRPSDDSRITRYQPEEELQYKWKHLHTREDVLNFARSRNRQMAVKMVNMQPFYPFLVKAFPKIRIIEIVRNGLDVGLSIEKKRWFSDHSLDHIESVSMKKEFKDKGRKKFIPWWVRNGDESRFREFSDFTRGIYCWRTLLEKSSSIKSSNQNYLQIRYEDLVKNPEKLMRKTASFLKTKPGKLTSSILARVDRDKPTGCQKYPVDCVDRNELLKMLRLMKKMGYKPAI